jgi:hypothetical protein
MLKPSPRPAWPVTPKVPDPTAPTRPKARDDIDFDNLRQFAASQNLDIVALQEIGSPAALTRVLCFGVQV